MYPVSAVLIFIKILLISFFINAQDMYDFHTDPARQIRYQQDKKTIQEEPARQRVLKEINTDSLCGEPIAGYRMLTNTAMGERTNKILTTLGFNRDQGQLGWCYAHVAADLATFALGSNPVSSADMAIQFGNYSNEYSSNNPLDWVCKRNKEIANGGWVENAFNYTRIMGFCSESALPTAPFAKTNETQLGEYVAQMNSRVGRVCDVKTLNTIEKFVGSESVRSVAAAITAGQTNSLKVIADASCAGKRQNTDYYLRSSYFEFGNSLEKAKEVKSIVSELKSGKPVGVSLDVHGLLLDECLDGPLKQIRRNGLNVVRTCSNSRDFVDSFSKLAPHAMTAVGTRMVGGKCVLLLRNSWGGECGCFNKKIKCDPEFVHVPVDYFEKNFFGVDYLRRNQ